MGTTKAEIGARIKQALDTSGKKQKHLAEALGITEASVSSYMKGNSLPTAAGFAVLSELTKTSIDWIITGKPPTAEILMNSLEPEEMNKLRGTFSPGSMGATIVRDYSGAIAGSQCAENAQTNGVEQFILSAIKAADSETVGAVMELLIKRRSKPEGRNGTEG